MTILFHLPVFVVILLAQERGMSSLFVGEYFLTRILTHYKPHSYPLTLTILESHYLNSSSPSSSLSSSFLLLTYLSLTLFYFPLIFFRSRIFSFLPTGRGDGQSWNKTSSIIIKPSVLPEHYWFKRCLYLGDVTHSDSYRAAVIAAAVVSAGM